MALPMLLPILFAYCLHLSVIAAFIPRNKFYVPVEVKVKLKTDVLREN